MSGTKKEKVQEFNIFNCLSCEGEPEFEKEALLEHLRTVHGIDTSVGLMGTREMLMHADGQGFCKYLFQWKLDCGVIFTQAICRRK